MQGAKAPCSMIFVFSIPCSFVLNSLNDLSWQRTGQDRSLRKVFYSLSPFTLFSVKEVLFFYVKLAFYSGKEVQFFPVKPAFAGDSFIIFREKSSVFSRQISSRWLYDYSFLSRHPSLVTGHQNGEKNVFVY
jgi:hypothetical protein